MYIYINIYICIYIYIYNPGLILDSSVSYPGLNRLFRAKPGSSVVPPCSSVTFPGIPGLIRGSPVVILELCGAHPGLDRGSSVTNIPRMSHGRVTDSWTSPGGLPDESRTTRMSPGRAPDGSSRSQSGARASCIKHVNTSGQRINPDHPGPRRMSPGSTRITPDHIRGLEPGKCDLGLSLRTIGAVVEVQRHFAWVLQWALGLSSGIWYFLSMFTYKLDKSDIQREILANIDM